MVRIMGGVAMHYLRAGERCIATAALVDSPVRNVRWLQGGSATYLCENLHPLPGLSGVHLLCSNIGVEGEGLRDWLLWDGCKIGSRHAATRRRLTRSGSLYRTKSTLTTNKRPIRHSQS